MDQGLSSSGRPVRGLLVAPSRVMPGRTTICTLHDGSLPIVDVVARGGVVDDWRVAPRTARKAFGVGGAGRIGLPSACAPDVVRRRDDRPATAMTTAATQGWRRWFASTGAPPMWRPVLYAVAGLVVGGALGAVLTPQKGAVLAGLTGALVAAAGSRGPTKVSLRLAALATAGGVIVVFAAFVITGHPWWAAVAMAAVAVLTSAIAAAGLIGAALGMLGSVGFVLTVIGAATVGLVPEVSVLSGPYGPCWARWAA
jgi:hypothetical protein